MKTFENCVLGLERQLLTQAIRGLAAAYRDCHGSTPVEINEGNCEGFAGEVKQLCPFARVTSDEILSRGATADHYFVEHRGRFYDSERPEGVDDWRQLPCLVRQRAFRAQLLTLGGRVV